MEASEALDLFTIGSIDESPLASDRRDISWQPAQISEATSPRGKKKPTPLKMDSETLNTSPPTAKKKKFSWRSEIKGKLGSPATSPDSVSSRKSSTKPKKPRSPKLSPFSRIASFAKSFSTLTDSPKSSPKSSPKTSPKEEKTVPTTPTRDAAFKRAAEEAAEAERAAMIATTSAKRLSRTRHDSEGEKLELASGLGSIKSRNSGLGSGKSRSSGLGSGKTRTSEQTPQSPTMDPEQKFEASVAPSVAELDPDSDPEFDEPEENRFVVPENKDSNKFDPLTTGARTLLRMHDSLTANPHHEAKINPQAFHLMFEVHAAGNTAVGADREHMEIKASLYCAGAIKDFITEEFSLSLTPDGTPQLEENALPSCVFTGLHLKDVRDGDLFLVIRAYSIGDSSNGGDMSPAASRKSSFTPRLSRAQGSRRGVFSPSSRAGSGVSIVPEGGDVGTVRKPMGVAVVEIPFPAVKYLMLATSRKEKTQQRISFMSCRDSRRLPTLHQDIIGDSQSNDSKLTSSYISLVASFALWRGDMLAASHLTTENCPSSFSNTSQCAAGARDAKFDLLSPSVRKGFRSQQKDSSKDAKSNSKNPMALGASLTPPTRTRGASFYALSGKGDRPGLQQIQGVPASVMRKKKQRSQPSAKFLRAKAAFTDSISIMEDGTPILKRSSGFEPIKAATGPLNEEWIRPQKCPFGDLDASRSSIIPRRGGKELPSPAPPCLFVTLEKAQGERAWDYLGVGKWRKAGKGKKVLLRVQLKNNESYKPFPRSISGGYGFTSPNVQVYETSVFRPTDNTGNTLGERIRIIPPNNGEISRNSRSGVSSSRGDYGSNAVSPFWGEKCHLFLQYLVVGADGESAAIGYSFLKLTDIPHNDRTIHMSLPVLKYSKKSQRSTETSEYLKFQPKLISELQHGSFVVSLDLSCLPRDAHIAALLHPGPKTPRSTFQRLRTSPLNNIHWSIEELWEKTFAMIRNPQAKIHHKDAALFLSFLCSKDPARNERDIAHLKRVLGYSDALRVTRDDRELITCFHIAEHIRRWVDEDYKPVDGDKKAAIVILREIEKFLQNHSLTDPAPPDKPEIWADILEVVRGGSLLFRVVSKLCPSSEGWNELEEPMIGIIIFTCLLLKKIITKTDYKSVEVKLFQDCTLSEIPKWLKITGKIISKAKRLSVVRLFWEALTMACEKDSVGLRTPMVHLQSVSKLIDVGLLKFNPGFRTRVVKRLLPKIKNNVRTNWMQLKILSIDIAAHILEALRSAGPTTLHDSPKNGEEGGSWLESEVEGQLEALMKRKAKAIATNNAAEVYKCDFEMDELREGLQDFKLSKSEDEKQREELIRSLVELVPQINDLALDLLENQVEFKDVHLNHEKALALLASCLCTMGYVATSSTYTPQGYLIDVLKRSGIPEVHQSEGLRQSPEINCELQLYQLMDVCKGFAVGSCFDRTWIQMRLAELEYISCILTQARPICIKPHTSAKFRRKYWTLAATLLSATTPIPAPLRLLDSSGMDETSRKSREMSEKFCSQVANGFLERLAKKAATEASSALMALNPIAFTEMAADVLPLATELAHDSRDYVSSLASELLYRLAEGFWIRERSLKNLEKMIAWLAKRLVETEIASERGGEKTMPKVLGKINLKTEAPALYSYQKVLSTNLKRALNVRISEKKVTDFGFVEACSEFFKNTKKTFLALYIVHALPETPALRDQIVDAHITLIDHYKRVEARALLTAYGWRLAELQVSLERAYTLVRIANGMGWSDRMVCAYKSLPAETEAWRHVHLLLEARDVFESIGDYGNCAEVCRILSDALEHHVCDINGFCTELKLRAGYVERLIMSDFAYSQYYLVVFGCQGFPSDTLGQSFIYRSDSKLSDFASNLSALYPGSKIIKKNTMKKARNQHALSIQKVSVSSVARCNGKLRAWELKEGKVRYRTHLENNNVSAFSYLTTYANDDPEVIRLTEKQEDTKNKKSQRVVLSPRDSPKSSPRRRIKIRNGIKNEETKNSVIVETFLIPEESMPCARRRVLVKMRKNRLLTPIQAAAANLKERREFIRCNTRELDLKIGATENIKVELSRVANQTKDTLDEALGGTIKAWIQKFLLTKTAKPSHWHSLSLADFKIQLKMLESQIVESLEVFDEGCGPSLKPLLALLKNMQKNFTRSVDNALSKANARVKKSSSTTDNKNSTFGSIHSRMSGRGSIFSNMSRDSFSTSARDSGVMMSPIAKISTPKRAGGPSRVPKISIS